jgi:hydroxyacylglutathione hydrolase
MPTITPVKAFTDNYIWVLHQHGEACAIDPGDAAPLTTFLRAQKLQLRAVLVTHHHADHAGGLAALAAEWPDLRIIGPAHIDGVTEPVADGDVTEWHGERFAVLAVPGHTLDHLAYHGTDMLFCGDTLFAAGCGRLFEGSPAQMFASLARLASLPAHTRIFPAHEYTLANLAFANEAEPDNEAVVRRRDEARALRAKDLPTLPGRLEQELATNPFLRTFSPTICQTAEQFASRNLNSELEIFTALRAWKDVFKPQHL